jgi:hypothetical protein
MASENTEYTEDMEDTKPLNPYLERIACKDPDERRLALETILTEEGFVFTTQEEEPSVKFPRGTRNYLLPSSDEQPGLLFCAHYDAVPGSCGYNDNAAAVCILIELAKTLRQEGIGADFAFFDGEETGNFGSKLYVSQLDRKSVAGVINLDMCGYGDSLVIYGKGHEKAPVFRSVCSKTFLEPYHGTVVPFLPKGDDVSFARTKIPTLSIAMVPRWDIQYLKTLSTFGDGLLGRPPEFDMILGQMEVVTTMHGGFRDTLEWIQPEAMQNVYEYVLAVARTPVNNSKKRFGLF